MNRAVGFTAIWRGSEAEIARAEAAERRALAYFPDLKLHKAQVGDVTLHLWGRGEVANCTHRLPDGALLALVGSPVGEYSWEWIEDQFSGLTSLQNFRLPWDGRVVLLYIRADGQQVIFWNDWLGCIPVFYAKGAQDWIASTLEPAVVAARQFTSADFFLPAVVTLLIQGSYLSDWTLFRDMKVMQPDAVTIWDEREVRTVACDTIQATQDRWLTGWDDLVDEMYELSKQAILKVLEGQSEWVVPLSSGLDSRLIATVGANAGKDIRTYTWGGKRSKEAIFSQKIAQALGLPWKAIGLDEKYLENHVRQWADMFGSAMHFHGMYQFPFLNDLKQEGNRKIISGFMGDHLAGFEIQFINEAFPNPEQRTCYILPTSWSFWKVEELPLLFRFSIDQALEQLADEISLSKRSYPGPWFLQQHFFLMWSRQRYFTYFQSMLCDYWFGVATPFIDRAYARFGFSLPRAVLDDRRLQIDMMRRYYPEVMSVPGSFAREPAISTGRYLMKRRLVQALPSGLARRLFPEFNKERKHSSDITSLQASKEKAIWPIPDMQSELEKWFEPLSVRRAYQAAMSGDVISVRKLQAIQTLAYRMANNLPE